MYTNIKNMKPTLLLIVFAFVFSGAFAQQQCDTCVIRADTAAFKSMLEKKDGILIDVRTPAEYKSSHIKGAINIDYRAASFEKKIGKLDKRKTYYLYCGTGNRSEQAAVYMKSKGFCKVVSLKRGLAAWKEAGYPLEAP